MQTRNKGLFGLFVATLVGSAGCQAPLNRRPLPEAAADPKASPVVKTSFTPSADGSTGIVAMPAVGGDAVARRLATTPPPTAPAVQPNQGPRPLAGAPETWRRLATTPPSTPPAGSPPAGPANTYSASLAPLAVASIFSAPNANAQPASRPPGLLDPGILGARFPGNREPEVRKTAQDADPMNPPMSYPVDPSPTGPHGSLLTLGDAIQATLNANPDLHSAIHRTQVAEEALANARAQFFPLLALNDSFVVSNNPLNKFTYLLSRGALNPAAPFALPANVGNFQLQTHFQQVVYAGGQRTALARSAEADREATVYSLATARNKILFQVAEAYYRLYEARELVGVRRESVAQVESQLQNVQARLRSDSAVKADELKVQARYSQVREALANSENQYELAWSVLENVTGVHFGGRLLPDVVPPAPWSAHIEEIESAVVEAMNQRPEIGELANRKLSAEHVIRAAQGSRYPNVSMFADNNVYAGRISSQDSFTVGLVLTLNLFDFGRTKSSIRQAQAQAREIIAKNQRAVLDIELDVRRSALQLKDAQERKTYTASAVSTAEENLRLFESRYKTQSATITDLLEAQVALSDVRVADTNAGAEIEIARASLERAVGRLSNIGTAQGPAIP